MFRVAAACAVSVAVAQVPLVELGNAANPGVMMPAIGLGTGAYSNNPAVGYNGYPECWSSIGGCGAFVQVGGRRLDCANSYQDQVDVGIAMNAAITAGTVTREEIFLLSKTGPGNPLGYNDTLVQFSGILSDMNITYVDLLLIHWPWDSRPQGNVTSNVTSSTDPLCNHADPAYSEKGCRISTWKAMLSIWASGGARAIGVSNFNTTHFEEFREAGLIMPALTQNPFHLYRSATQMDLLAYTARHGITFLGYSPFGVPDWKVYPTPALPSTNQLELPLVRAIAANHSATPAQVIIAWQWALGIPVNPRSMNASHMRDNLAAYSTVTLVQSEIDALSSVTQDECQDDHTWYECAY